MSQSLNIKIAGLHSFPSDLSAVPPGALTEASNIILDQDSIAAPRRGYDYLAHGSSVQSQFSDPTFRANKLFFYKGSVLCHYDSNLLAYHDPTSGWTNYSGNYAPPSNATTCTTVLGSAVVTSLGSSTGLVVGQAVYGSGIPVGTNLVSFTSTTATLSQVATVSASSVAITFVVAKVRSAQANSNFYYTSSSGVQKIDSVTGTPVPVGAPQALDIQTSICASVSKTCTSSTSVNPTILTSVSSMTGIAIGMAISGTGIGTNALVLSFTATTITMSVAATGSGTNSITFAAASTWLSTTFAVNAAPTTGYRVLWGVTDANNNLILGAPSTFSQITNTTASSVAINVNFTVPSGITTANFYQIYRSAAVNGTPSDEEQLVYQSNPLATDITAGFITVSDIVPDSLRGTTIYTAPSQGGLTSSNVEPPLAQDLAVFRDCMFYGNVSTQQTYFLNLIGCGLPSGIVSGNTLTIGGVAYTADTAENTATGHFLVTQAFISSGITGTTHTNTTIDSLSSTTGVLVGMAVSGTGIQASSFVTVINSSSSVTISQATTASASGVAITFTGDSAAQAIRDTALSLVRVINRYASSTVYAIYASVTNGLPGMMTIQSKTVGSTPFALTSNNQTCWSPVIPSSGTAQSSTNQVNKNGLYYSKQFQPEAVPLSQYVPIGSADKNILRIIALRDSLFILKEDGTFLLTGTDPTNFLVRPLDFTSILIAPESAVVLNNQIYCLTTQGVVALSEVGAPIMSHPIEGDLTRLNSQNYALLQTSSFGVAYESDRAYYLFCITNAADNGPTQYWRWNYITSTWTHGTLSKTCGAVNPVDTRLYLGNSGAPIIDVERKNLVYSDYADYQSTQTISAIDNTNTILTISSSDTITAGSIVYQSATVFGTVASTNPIAGTVTLTLPTPSLTVAGCDILAPISCTMSWAPVTLDNPGFTKQLSEATLVFLSDFNGQATVGFVTDVSPGVGTELIQGGAVGGWGLFAWGGPNEVISGGTINVLGAPFGGDPRRRQVRVSVTRNHQRCSLLTVSFDHSYAYSPWKLQGISLIGNLVSERTAN